MGGSLNVLLFYYRMVANLCEINDNSVRDSGGVGSVNITNK